MSEYDIKKAVDTLKKGGTVIAPTDSVYGLFGDALNEKTVERIRGIKGSDGRKQFQIAVLEQDAGKYGKLNESAVKLIERFWPGDVNLIVEKTTLVPDYISESTVCLTCHRNKTIDSIVRGVGRPLVSTSVNLSGMPPAVRIQDIQKEIRERADFVIDGGETKNKKPNTIVDLTVNPARIIREGPVSRGELEHLIQIEQ